MKIKIGSRESRLAVIQAQIVESWLEKQGHATEIITMKTSGDLILDKTLDKIGGKGLFVKELDAALLDGRIDIAVHSCKDLPMELHPHLPLAAVSSREDARDALVLPLGIKELGADKPIGCSSKRRALQLARLYPGAAVIPLRGNVLTRLDKLDQGEYAAIVLAIAGLKRLGLAERANRLFSPAEMLPAAGQGVLAIQARDDFDPALFSGFHDETAWQAICAERAFVAALGGGCSSPVAAYAEISGQDMVLTGLLPLDNGDFRIKSISGPRDTGLNLARDLAKEMS